MSKFIVILTAFLITACSSVKTQVVENVRLERVKIPPSLLEIPPLKRPVANNEIDILNAYSALFYEYKRLEINIKKIRELSE